MDKTSKSTQGLGASIRHASEFRVHPLGFFYLEESVGPGRTRRIHVWLPGEPTRPEIATCHSHAFDVESVVLIGRLENVVFEFVQKPGGPIHQLEVLYTGDRSGLVPTGRTGTLRVVASFFSSPSEESYSIRAGVIHRADAVRRPCVTVLRTTRQFEQSYSYGTGTPERAFDRRIVTPGEARSIKKSCRP